MKEAKFYDQIAPYYRKLSEPRTSYINAVNRTVVNAILLSQSPVVSMLDVGAADGVRGMQIAEKIHAKKLTLLEPSKEMVILINKQNQSKNHYLKVVQGYVENLPTVLNKEGGKFDVITMLWNVLGHVPDRQSRITALRNLKQLLSTDGRLYFDINNRYNVKAYGKDIVKNNYTVDINNPSGLYDNNGDILYKMHADSKEILAWGHVFNPREIKTLIEESGLKVIDHHLIDYDTGDLAASFGQGNPLFICSA